MKLKRLSMAKIIQLIFILIFASLISGKEKDLSKKLYLQKDMEIGVCEGDENLMFGNIGIVWIDFKNQIYVGDQKMNRIQVFNHDGKFIKSLTFKKGDGPGEVISFTSFLTLKPNLLIVKHAFKPKISIFKIENGLSFLRDINLDFSPSIRGIAPEKGNRIYVAGLRKEKILHIYDINGNLIKSFGEPFFVPPKLLQFKEIPFIRTPWAIDSSNGFLFVFNPHKYELLIFKDEKLIKTIREELPYSPLQTTKTNMEGAVGFFFENPVVLSYKDTIYIWKRPDFSKEDSFLDIFINFKYHGTISVKNWKLKAIDRNGKLYFAEEEEFPKLIRCSLKEK